MSVHQNLALQVCYSVQLNTDRCELVRQADLSLLGASLAFSAVKFEPLGFDDEGEGLVPLVRIILLVLLVRPRWLARLVESTRPLSRSARTCCRRCGASHGCSSSRS